MDKEPGQLAYETRFEGFTLGPRGIAPAWADLPESGRAIWRRTEEALEQRTHARIHERLQAAVNAWLSEVRTHP